MHAGAAIELPTAAANLAVFLTVVTTADGAWFDADGADRGKVDVTLGKVFITELVFALNLCGKMLGAKRRVAKVTMAHAALAALLAALRTGNGIGSQLPATWTFIKTFETKGVALAVTLVETRTHLTPALFTGNQAVGAEALARRSTDAK
jgi:hypothetical protein